MTSFLRAAIFRLNFSIVPFRWFSSLLCVLNVFFKSVTCSLESSENNLRFGVFFGSDISEMSAKNFAVFGEILGDVDGRRCLLEVDGSAVGEYSGTYSLRAG